MIEQVDILRRLLASKTSGERAKVSAFLLAPALLVGLALANGQRGAAALGLANPVGIAELRTELALDGQTTIRPGVALILEPTEAAAFFVMRGSGGRVWTSLDEAAIQANRDRLLLSTSGLSSRSPFIGISSPVTLVLDGELDHEVRVPGGVNDIENNRLPSRRSQAILSSVLFACVFAFGIALTAGVPREIPH